MTGITEGLVAEEFMRRIAVPMSRTNAHGIGYTAVGPDGSLFSERWLNNDQFFDTSNVMTPKIAKLLLPYANRLPKGALNDNYSRLGKVDFSTAKTVTMHTRFATCSRDFVNTHPFIYEDTSLIHNGTIRNAFSTSYMTGLDVNKLSTCDSEAALQTYLSQGVNLDTSAAKKWLDLLSGSWAFGILSRNAENNRVLDVVRGTSFLYYMEIDGLGKVFTTDDDDAKLVVKDMGLTFVTEPKMVSNDEMYRYDAVTGEFLTTVDIKPVYQRNWNNQSFFNSKGGERTTTTSGTSNSPSQNASKGKRVGENLLVLIDSLKDDPHAMSLLPDIFVDNSSIKNLKIDFRKVKLHTYDLREPLIDRLDVFDLVFNTSLLGKFESLPIQLKEYIIETDKAQGFKSARNLIDSIIEKKNSNAG